MGVIPLYPLASFYLIKPFLSNKPNLFGPQDDGR